MPTILPVALFWFLDYTSVIHDTSLLAALIVAVGYRQIFSGNIQGITLSGQTALLWKPFQAWVQKVTTRIDELNTRYQYRFYEEVRSTLASDPNLVDRLEALVFERTADPAAFALELQPLKQLVAQVPPVPWASRRLVDRLWRELREREPEDYGYLLRRRRLIGWWQYWQWLGKGRSKLITGTILVVLFLAFLSVGAWSGPNRLWRPLQYHQFRLLKANGSQRDYWRSRNYLASEVTRADPSETPDQAMARRVVVVAPLIDELAFKDVTEQQAARVLRLMVDVHSLDVDQVTIPRLIESLRGENVDVRLRTNGTLLDLQAADYPMAPVDREPFKPLTAWIPKQDETPGQTDHFVQLWKQWWAAATYPASAVAPMAPSSIEKGLQNGGTVELKGVEFDFDQATLRPESAAILSEADSVLGRHPDWKVSIEGHTDSRGGARYNQRLSERRAAAVRSALMNSYHVDPGRLTSKGFGATRPVASNDTDEGRARNRRVELRRLP